MLVPQRRVLLMKLLVARFFLENGHQDKDIAVLAII